MRYLAPVGSRTADLWIPLAGLAYRSGDSEFQRGWQHLYFLEEAPR